VLRWSLEWDRRKERSSSRVEPCEPAAMRLRREWREKGEKTKFFSWYSSFENKCFAMLRATSVWHLIGFRRSIFAFQNPKP
jgi:hypothetical protein